MKKFSSKLASLLLITPLFASAGLFKLKYVSDTLGLGASVVQPALDDAADEVNKKLPAASTKEKYLTGMANANAMSAAGVTTSYGTVFKKVLVGVTASGGVDLGSKKFGDFGDMTKNPEQFSGFGVQAALIAGINVGNLFGYQSSLLDLDRLNVYISGFALNRTYDVAKAKYFGLGLGAQYRLIGESNWLGRSVKWTGIEIGTGLLYSRLDVDATVKLDKTYNTTTNGQPTTITLSNSNALINAKVGTVSIPIEASTGLRLFYFFKLIGGLGLDLNFGSTKGDGTLSSGSTATGTYQGSTVTADPSFEIDGSKGPDFASLRAFFGPQIEFGVGTVFATVHKALTNKTVAVNAGLNFFW